MRAAALLCTALLCFSACKKTVEGETKNWDRGTTKVNELKALYPGFSAALDAHMASAKAMMDSAKSMSDEEAAADKMASANKLLNGGLVSNLSNVDKQIKSLKSKVVDASSGATDAAGYVGYRAAAQNAQRTLENVSALLKKGAKDATAGNVIVKKALSDLKAAGKNLDKIAKKAKAQNKSATGVKKGITGKAAPKKPVATTWKCAYCGGINPASKLKCSGCGASKSVKK